MAAAADGGTSSPCHLRLGPPRRSDSPARRSPRPDAPPPPAPDAQIGAAAGAPDHAPPPPAPDAQIGAAAGALPAVAVFEQHPTHAEMITNYLLPYARDGTRPAFVHCAEVYVDGVGPEQLTADYAPTRAIDDGTKRWMFFSHMVPLPGDAGRMKRRIEGRGTWQSEKGNIEVKDALTDVLVGHRRTLSFVETGSKLRHGWIMEELTLHPAPQDQHLMVCRIYPSPRPRHETSSGTGASSSAHSVAQPSRRKRTSNPSGSRPPKRAKCAAPKHDDHSIESCVTAMMKLELSISEKARALELFKDPVNRELFMTSKNLNPQAALLWLRNAAAKMSSCEDVKPATTVPYTSEELMMVTEEQLAASANAAWNSQQPPTSEQPGLPFPSLPASSLGRDDVHGPDEHVERHHNSPNTHKRSPDNNNDAQKSLTIAIADEYMGAVIGRAGRNINDVKQATGAWIRTSSKGDFVAGTTDREVVISGTQEAIDAAEAMLMDLVSVARRRNGGGEKLPVKPDTTPQEVEQQ